MGVLQSLPSRSQLLPVTLSPLAQPFGRLPAGFLWIALADNGAFLPVNNIPPLPTPHGMEYPLGFRMHLGVVHPRLEARGRHFPRSPRSCSRLNLRVLRSLTRGPQGQPPPLRTPHGRPGVQGIFPTSRGQAPHGWPMVHHSMATGIPISRGCCLALSVSHPIPCSPLPHPVTGPIPASRGLPIPRGCCAAPFHPPSRVSTPPGRQQPCGAGSLDLHPSGDRFVRLALVAPFPPPPLSPVPRPVTHLGIFPASCAFPVSWGRRVALATRPFLPRPLSPASRVFTPPGREQPFGAGPLDPHPSSDRFVSLALFAPFPPPSAWVVCSLQDLWWFLLPGPRTPHYPCLSPTWSAVVVVVFVFVFSRATRSLSSARLLNPVPPPPARSAFHALLCRCGVLFVFLCFFLPHPSLPCLLPCGSLLPACTHINSAQAISLCSPRCSFPVPSSSWVVALGGSWPCQVGAPPWRLTDFSALHPPLPSVSCPPSYCCSPAPCALRWSSPRHDCILRALTRLRACALSSDL